MTQIEHKTNHLRPRERDFGSIVLLSDVCGAKGSKLRTSKSILVALRIHYSLAVGLNQVHDSRTTRYQDGRRWLELFSIGYE